MGKSNAAFQLLTWTTGAGIAIGTNIDIGGVYVGATATTVTLKVGATTLLDCSDECLVFACGPASVTGAVTGTSSGGSFTVLYRKRSV